MKTASQAFGILAVWALTSSACFADLTINQPQVQGDGAIQINWDSKTNALYQIESRSDLTVDHWKIRETQFPSQGTNTVWLDVGDSETIPRIFYPSLDLMRFYRVSEIGVASNDSPAIAISFYDINGDPVTSTNASGLLQVDYSIDFDTLSNVLSEVEIFCDGQVVGRGYDASGYAWINTTEWVNGTHKIWAVARMTDSADTTPDSEEESESPENETGIGISSVQTMTFDNFISQYFVATPYFDTSAGQIQEITAQFKEDSTWYLYVLDANDDVIVAYEGEGTSLYVAWDGTDINGDEVSDGYYDYYIEATPTDGGDSMSMMQKSSSSSSVTNQESKPLSVIGQLTANTTPLVPFQPTSQTLMASTFEPVAAQFKHDPLIQIPTLDNNIISLKPVPPDTNTVSQPPPLPPMPDGEFSNIYPQSVSTVGNPQSLTSKRLVASSNVQPLDDGDSTTYYTDYPIRQNGAFFKGFAGTFGIGYQGDHPSWLDKGFFSMPSGASGFTSTWAPFGPLKNASGIANSFSTHMTPAGWRQAFVLANDSFQYTDLTGCSSGYCNGGGPNPYPGTFTTNIDLGLVIGHIVGADSTPYGAAMCYYPFWTSTNSGLAGNPNAYDWVAMADMDFGSYLYQHGSWSPLKWMCLYGCNSLRLNDVNDMWTKFLLPMPPNIHVLLGSDSKVYIVASFGSQFADDLNGVSSASGGNPMSLISSWYDAGKVAHQAAAHSRNPFKRPGTVVLSAVFRDSDYDSGEPGTASDSIWNYPTDYNVDWTAIDWQNQQVYP